MPRGRALGDPPVDFIFAPSDAVGTKADATGKLAAFFLGEGVLSAPADSPVSQVLPAEQPSDLHFKTPPEKWRRLITSAVASWGYKPPDYFLYPLDRLDRDQANSLIFLELERATPSYFKQHAAIHLG